MMFRRSIPNDFALLFRFSAIKTRSIHMLFVPFPLDVIWLVDREVVRTTTLRPWIGIAWEEADTVIELPSGSAAEVERGDRIRLVND